MPNLAVPRRTHEPLMTMVSDRVGHLGDSWADVRPLVQGLSFRHFILADV